MPTEEQAGGRTRSSPLQGLAGFRDRCLTVRPLLLGRHTVVLHAGSRRFSPLDVRSAESLGFEPREPLTRFNGFQDRRIQPLCHDSAERTPHQAASSYYMRLSMCRQWGIFRFFPSSRHSARCACPGSNRDPGLITGTRTSTSRVCQFRHKRTEPNDCM